VGQFSIGDPDQFCIGGYIMVERDFLLRKSAL
jgi:hypothetical protein